MSHAHLPDYALLLTKHLRPACGGALRRDDARNLLRRTIELHVITYEMKVHAWAFHPSRVELLLALPSARPIQASVSALFGYYTRRFNSRYRETGPVFRTKFVKKIVIGSDAITNAIEALHEEIRAASLLEKPGQEAFSSRRYYDEGAVDTIVTPYEPAVARFSQRDSSGIVRNVIA